MSKMTFEDYKWKMERQGERIEKLSRDVEASLEKVRELMKRVNKSKLEKKGLT